MKVIIAGSRSITNYETIKELLEPYKNVITEVVSGTARGVDKLGERWADNNNILIKRFPANWDEFGKAAGYIRNKEMAIYSDACIVFWDCKSSGSKHMINLAEKYKLRKKIFKIRL